MKPLNTDEQVVEDTHHHCPGMEKARRSGWELWRWVHGWELGIDLGEKGDAALVIGYCPLCGEKFS